VDRRVRRTGMTAARSLARVFQTADGLSRSPVELRDHAGGDDEEVTVVQENNAPLPTEQQTRCSFVDVARRSVVAGSSIKRFHAAFALPAYAISCGVKR